jgi:flagellar basal body rod protein FlgG
MDPLYISAAGMLAQNGALGLTAGNLANSQSPGYLAQVGIFSAFPNGTAIRTGPYPGALGPTSTGVAFSSSIDMGGSGVISTSNPNDLAIMGNNGFFTVRTPNGIAYTRDGQFTIDANGNLVTQQGAFVLGTNGKPIQLTKGVSFTVSPTGVVTQGTTTVGTLALFDLPTAGLQSLGNDLYTSATTTPFTGQVVQSSLNTSNVNLPSEMTQMINAQSWYQALTQMVNEESKRLATAATLGVVP